MARVLARSWGALVAQGVIAILFGLLFLFAPLATLTAAAVVFGVFAVLDGLAALMWAFARRRPASRGAPVLYGLAGIVIGLLAIFFPAITAIAFLYLLVAWALVIGVFRIIAALSLRREVEGEWALLATGIISVLFAIYVLFFPEGLDALLLAIGIFALIKGFLLIVSGLTVRRRLQERGEPGAGPREMPRAA
ncbi:MAG TPA: HdeD family acid-resistance protein [Longimicrobiales bacterium]|nr:HdeD family acid-resistance protein [Longimicrobiales bacterium]